MQETDSVLISIFFIACTVIAVCACDSPKVADNPSTLGVDFEWTKKSACSSISPPITVRNIPQETKYLRVMMVDLDYAAYDHGGGEVSYNGSAIIMEGALASYAGPCPPGVTHSYQITVQALSADKKLIFGRGYAVRKYPDGG
jgi:phosphatidylethanolamine-binding protein (PEBP) family uncharacterized protein